tara:strand:+ start:165 stop:716 length:552 start_codon:yes stop_codon:yes gene_type:complete
MLITACSKENDIIEDKFGSLSGVVKDNFGNPLSDATVVVYGKSRSTDDLGQFNFLLLPVGTHQIEVTKSTFKDLTSTVSISEGSKLNFTCDMEIAYVSLSLNKATITYDWRASVKKLSIRCNSEWSIESSDDWIYFSKMNGQGSHQINVTVRENTSSETRRDTVYINSPPAQKKIIITQTGKE